MDGAKADLVTKGVREAGRAIAAGVRIAWLVALRAVLRRAERNMVYGWVGGAEVDVLIQRQRKILG